MIQTTIKNIIARKLKPSDAIGHPIYLFREDAIVFYVGQSRQPLTRFMEHLGQTWQADASEVGTLILEQAPHSGTWTYELWTLEDCAQYLEPGLVAGDVDDAETALIRHFHPCFNVRYNLNPTPLPERYQKDDGNPYGAIMERMFGIKPLEENEA